MVRYVTLRVYCVKWHGTVQYGVMAEEEEADVI
jgi:hypothetical protein